MKIGNKYIINKAFFIKWLEIQLNNEIVLTYTIIKDFAPLEEFTFTQVISIPSTIDGDVVQVDFLLMDSLSVLKTKHDTVKNSINNVR